MAQAKADEDLCCPALPLNLRSHTQTYGSQKPALLCPAWAALPASQCAPGLTVFVTVVRDAVLTILRPTDRDALRALCGYRHLRLRTVYVN
jgi:hypothetical protein